MGHDTAKFLETSLMRQNVFIGLGFSHGVGFFRQSIQRYITKLSWKQFFTFTHTESSDQFNQSGQQIDELEIWQKLLRKSSYCLDWGHQRVIV